MATDILICVLQFFIMKLRMAIRPVIPTDTFPPLSESLAPVQAEEFAAAVDGEVAEGDLFGGGAGGAGGGAPRHMALQDFENQQNVVQQQQDLAAVRPRRGGGS